MENKRQVGGRSSFPSEHRHPSKDSSSSSPPPPPSSSAIFATVFGPSSTGLGKDNTNSSILGSLVNKDLRDQYGNPKYGTQDYMNQKNRGEKGSYYHHQTTEPCYLSSSIYYGGQEMYSPSNSQGTSSHNTFKKADQGDDDVNGSNSSEASRGNWWQGSLYY